jgi:hypothetical protein
MRRVLKIALAGAAIGLTSPASAAVLFQDYSGPDLATTIHAGSSPVDTGVTVYGSTTIAPTGNDVAFTGIRADDATATSIHITGGSGFASITDADYDSKVPSTADLYELIMDPTQDFTAYEFSIQLVEAGTVSIFYTLAGGSGWNFATDEGAISQKANTNNQYLLSGGTFSAIKIVSSSPIFEVKQNSIELAGAVPEPATWGMMLLGFLGVGTVLRRSRRRDGALMQIA